MELGGIPDAYELGAVPLRRRRAKASVAVYNEMMAEADAARTTAEWMALCRSHSVPAMVANGARDVLDDPQLDVTLFEERELEGEGRYRAMRPPLRFSKTPAAHPAGAAGAGGRHRRGVGRIRDRAGGVRLVGFRLFSQATGLGDPFITRHPPLEAEFSVEGGGVLFGPGGQLGEGGDAPLVEGRGEFRVRFPSSV